MRRQFAALGCAVAVGVVWAPPASGDHWPVAGGSAARSSNSAMAPGQAPITGVWRAADGSVRTPMVITGGGGPDVQRVAYGVAGATQVRIRVLATGAPVGPPEGINIDDGSLDQDASAFGQRGAVGFADTSTETKLGQLLIPHNDDATITGPRVYLARIRLDTGEKVADEVLGTDTNECGVESSPLLTPQTGGGRLLYFTITCNRPPAAEPQPGLNRYLVRQPLLGDSTTPEMTLGKPGFAPITNATELASPTLVILRDAAGTPRYHVAVPRQGGVDFFSAEDPLLDAAGSMAHPPSITATLEAPDEIAQTVLAPAGTAGDVAGGEGTGTSPAPALYVASAAQGNTKVYRFLQRGNEASLVIEKVTPPLPDSGTPAPGMATTEVVGPGGVSGGGTLVVTSQRNVNLLRTADLSVVRRLSDAPLPSGQGFGRNVAAVSGGHAYLTRDGNAELVPEQLVLRLDGLMPLAAPAFGRIDDKTAGLMIGQPAVARDRIVFGTSSGAFAYRATDPTAPVVTLIAPGDDAAVHGSVRLAARVVDAGGIESVTFRLATDGGATRTLETVSVPDPGSAFADAIFSMTFPTASVSNGTYLVEALATDASGNTSTSARRRIRIVNAGGTVGLPAGACAHGMSGSAAADRIVGSGAGDRILGGAGDDRLDGAAGHDCVLGQAGDDVLAGGTGDDLLEGAAGDDVLAGGTGRNRLDGGAGADVARGGRNDERFAGGAGNDTILGGAGRDTISGGAGKDTIKGEGGNDRLTGGSGNDVITGGGGSNRIDGGTGNDRISAHNGRRDVIVCGKGRDRVTADRGDRVSRSCERVTRRGKK